MIRALVILLLTTAASADAIRLRHLAVVDADVPVTLAMIADLSGEAAAGLGNVVIIDEPHLELGGGTQTARVDIERVRQALRDSDRCDFSVITLRGSACTVRPSGLVPARIGRINEPRVLPRLASTYPLTTLRGHVAVAVARSLDARPEDVRLTFDAGDARLLSTAALGRTVDASPTGLSDDMPVRITVYEGERIVLSETIRVSVQVRREVCILRDTKRRGEELSEADFIVERRWLRPMEEPVRATEAIGLASTGMLRAGKALMREHTAQPVVVEKGDLVKIHSVSGGIIVQMTARALADGRDGEVIEFAHVRGPGTFLARMSGRGHAVTVSRFMQEQQP